MDRLEHLFENSFLSVNIDIENVMISSFPNKIVIGEPFLDGYKSEKSFHFFLHDIKYLFSALSKCILYITFEKPENSGKILDRSSSEKYCWEGLEFIHESENGEQEMERKFKLTKKVNCNDCYEIIFSLQQTESLIKIINDLILTMMCLKYQHRNILDKLINNKLLSNISEKENIASTLIEQGFKDNIAPLVDLIFYYQDIFLILIETNELKQKLLHPQFFIDTIESAIRTESDACAQN